MAPKSLFQQAPELFLGRAMVSARGAHNIFFDHGTADVISAEAQPKLAGF